jgi:hypothetical protein
MSMTEGKLSSALVKLLRQELPTGVIFKHWDHITAGVPDISVTWNHRTTWYEVKYITKGIFQRGQQRRVIEQMGRQGVAWYVIYLATPIRSTYIVHPSKLDTFTQDFVMMTAGFAPQLVVDHLRSTL